jgi:hypothetical protein
LGAASLDEKRTLLRTDSDSQPLALGASGARCAPRCRGDHLYHPFVVTVCVQNMRDARRVSSSATTRHRWQRQRPSGAALSGGRIRYGQFLVEVRTELLRTWLEFSTIYLRWRIRTDFQ